MATGRPLLDRLGDKFTVGDGCWEWTAAKSVGYGLIKVDGKMECAHRVVYELMVGPLPSDGRRFHLDHLCRNPSCVRPDHLELVTRRENILRGVGATAINAAKTHCKYGHALIGTNLAPDARGIRRCRKCRNRRQRERNQRLREQD